MADERFIKKIKLADGITRSIYDSGAPRSDAAVVNTLKVSAMTTQSSTDFDVVVIDTNADTKRRSTNNLLADIGGCSYVMDESTGTLTLKLGK